MSSPSLSEAKQTLRRQVRESLRQMTDRVLAEWSEQLVQRLQERADLWDHPGTVALFGGLRSEPDLLTQFLPWLRQRGWRTVLFAVAGTELQPVEVRSVEDCQRGPLGVWEPVGTQTVPLAELDVILVPALAYAKKQGARLGRGGGFYDRLLSKPELRARCVGVVFQVQLLPEIPREAHDRSVPEVITERGSA